MPNKIIALKPDVNVRRGMNTGAGILGVIHNGDQLDMIGQPINGVFPGEKWAQVIWPNDLSVNAYICLKLANGTEMCRIETGNVLNIDYVRGWNDCLDAAHAALVKMRK